MHLGNSGSTHKDCSFHSNKEYVFNESDGSNLCARDCSTAWISNFDHIRQRPEVCIEILESVSESDGDQA